MAAYGPFGTIEKNVRTAKGGVIIEFPLIRLMAFFMNL